VDSESPRVASTVRFACRRCRIALFTPGDIVASAGAGNAVVGSANVDTDNGAAEIRAACGPGWVAAIAAGAQALCPKCGSKIGRGLADGSGVSVPYSRVDRRLRRIPPSAPGARGGGKKKKKKKKKKNRNF
jgi:hypothetical protein